MRKFVEKTISRIRGVEYHIDSAISTQQLFSSVASRSWMVLRGAFLKCRLKKAGKLLFIGKHVRIKSGKKISIGSSSTIHDGCYINAMCRDGIEIGDLFVLGRNSTIECTGVISEQGESLKIGNNVGISQGAFISVRGKVDIGDDTIIGPNVTIIAENHNHGDINKPIRLQGVSRKGIKIGSNCWLGTGVTILDGVTIGDGAVVAAGAVVTRNVEPHTIVGGVPAKVIRHT